MPDANPCLTCGACCAHYRVSFFWAEADPSQGGRVPPEWVEDLPPHRSCMRGTNQPHPRCAALRGVVGEQVFCEIYPNTPSPCEEFGVQMKNGRPTASPEELARCNHARSLYGLPELDLPAG